METEHAAKIKKALDTLLKTTFIETEFIKLEHREAVESLTLLDELVVKLQRTATSEE